MSKVKDKYKVRYSVEPWNKPPENPEKTRQVAEGIRVTGTDYGYTDVLFVVSILLNEKDDAVDSIAMFSTVGGANPPRSLLELVRNQINHHLEHHCAPPPPPPERN